MNQPTHTQGKDYWRPLGICILGSLYISIKGVNFSESVIS